MKIPSTILLTFRICCIVITSTVVIFHITSMKLLLPKTQFDEKYKAITSVKNKTIEKRNDPLFVTEPSITASSTSSNKTFTRCPKKFRKLVWFEKNPTSIMYKVYEPVYRAFHSRNFSRTESIERAHFLWRYQPKQSDGFYGTLRPWQRFNQFPNTNKWDDKDELAITMNHYYTKQGIPRLHSFPESYVLHQSDGLQAFQNRLLDEHGGMNIPWVLKEPSVNAGKGVSILPPRSHELKKIVDTIQSTLKHNPEERRVVQAYICDEMTYTGRKFDVRVFWAVVSVSPLIVVYNTEHNYARIGAATYDESNVGNSTNRNYLTTSTLKSDEKKATWDEFRESIENHVFGSDSNHWHRFSENIYGQKETGILETINSIQRDPFGHIQKQIKTVIGHLVDAYKDITFNSRSMVAENAFSLHAADMIIDNNLDVYIIEGTDGPGKDEDYDFRIKGHDELYGSLIDMVEEVISNQEEGLPLDVLAMKKKGILGGYEVVYNDGWFEDYRYEQLPQRGCVGSRIRESDNTISDSEVEVDTSEPSEVASSNRSPSLIRTVNPAKFTALPKRTINATTKTFWAPRLIDRVYEPVARSFRRNGWTPVDDLEDAQLIYQTHEKFEIDKDDSPRVQSWQWISQFPSQYPFFRGKHLQYLDVGSKLGRVCQPIVNTGRRRTPIEAVVYILLLSLDPLIVLFHDGFVDIPYFQSDENEFVDVPKLDGTTQRIWKGSWTAFQYYLNRAYANLAPPGTANSNTTTAVASILVDPMTHVRNQMKASLVKMAEGFSNYTLEQGLEDSYASFALFQARFQVDLNLNTFATNASHSFVMGEEHAEIVSLHDDLYGSAFRLLEHLNATLASEDISGEIGRREIMQQYEWLIRPNKNASKTKSWKFQYEWNSKAKRCLSNSKRGKKKKRKGIIH